MSFKSSVNIKFDLGKKEYFQRYLPTPSHAESLLGLLKGLNNREEGKSHIIIGPYGTGKSLIGTIVTSIASKNIDNKTLNNLQKRFDKLDDYIYQELEEVKTMPKNYLPVVLNGNEGSFRKAIISAISRTILEQNINIVIPGIITKIVKTIDLWKKEYLKTYRQFSNLIKEKGFSMKEWIFEIHSQNIQEIEWFKGIFPILTSGSEFVADYEEDFIYQVKTVLSELHEKELGLFIVYDEFGRFLQNLKSEEIYQTMQDIQDLAELSDHNEFSNLHLLFISHRNFRQYFLDFGQEYQNEFQRIEKRFKIYHIESDSSTFIRLAQATIEQIQETNNMNLVDQEQLVQGLRKYPLFPELNQVEVEKLVIKGAYPIHPVTLYLLPHLSSVFGQNERTLFTFLESMDKGGLKSFVSKEKGFYFPYRLFDYFFPSLNNIELEDDHQHVVSLFKKIQVKIPGLLSEQLTNELRIIKFITLWNLAGLQSKFKLTTDFVRFSLGIDHDTLHESLENLVSLKVLRFNHILEYWELFEGSSINLEEQIKKKSDTINITRKKRIEILDKHLEKYFYLANEYNDEKSMTRFASVNLIYSSEILNNQYNPQLILREKNSDTLINYVLLEDITHFEETIERLKELQDQYSFFCVPKYEYHSIEKKIFEYQVVIESLQDEDLLKQDEQIQKELIIKKEELSYQIKNFTRRYSKFDSDLYWIHGSKRIEIHSEIALQNAISKSMDRIYPLTPIIRNDSYNRRIINRVQQKAGYLVVDHILQHYQESQLGIEGNGPEYLIYATVFKNNNINLNQLDSISSKEFKELRNRLLEVLLRSSEGKLSDLVEVLRKEPFGIRKPLIPILITSLLRDTWDNIMLYRNGMFVSDINGEKWFKMVDEAEQYDFIYYEFSKDYNQFFIQLEDLFSFKVEEDFKQLPKHLRAMNLLLKWLRQLPRFTQISSRVTEDVNQLKDVIRQAEVNPNKALRKLFALYHNNLDKLEKDTNELEGFLSVKVQSLVNNVYEIIGVGSYDEAKEWANNQEVIYQKNNLVVRTILDSQTENLIYYLALNLVGVAIEEWSDKTEDMFFIQLQSELRKLRENNQPSDNYIEIKIDDKVKAIPKIELSTKTKTLYRNVERIIRNGGRTVPKEEIECLIYNLLEEFVK